VSYDVRVSMYMYLTIWWADWQPTLPQPWHPEDLRRPVPTIEHLQLQQPYNRSPTPTPVWRARTAQSRTRIAL